MKKALLTLAIATALPLTSAHAELSFNGFASIVAGKASSGDTLWGYDDDVDFKQDSLFALQTSADLGEGLSATVQIISRGENDWDTEFEWAYLSYEVSDQTRVSVGRLRTPLYINSEYLDVSYAYPWITPPEGFYDLSADTYEGVGITHNFTLGEFDTQAQFFFGSNSEEIAISGVPISGGSLDNMYGGALTFNRDWLTLRTAYTTALATYPIEPLAQLSAAWQNIPGFDQIASDLIFDGDRAEFLEFGLQIDYNNLLVIAEYVEETYDGGVPIGDEESWYAMLGYRFDNVLVHATYGKDDETPSSLLGRIPAGNTGNAGFDGLVGITRGLVDGEREDSYYYILGARWDFHDSAALKVEFSQFEDDLLNEDASLVRTALVTVF